MKAIYAWLVSLIFCRYQAPLAPAVSLLDLLLEWAHRDYDLVIIECRPKVKTRIITRIENQFETIGELSSEEAEKILLEIEDHSSSKAITNYLCCAEITQVECNGLVFTIELDVLPVCPSGIDVGIRITCID